MSRPSPLTPDPTPLISIAIGGVVYRLALVDEDLLHPRDGSRCNGLTWPDLALIQVDGRLPATVRRKVLWHEIGHAFKSELDIHEATHLPEEEFCNLVAQALCVIAPKLYLQLWLFAMRRMVADDVIMIPGCEEPIPVIRYRES